jgi:hypothetical protein
VRVALFQLGRVSRFHQTDCATVAAHRSSEAETERTEVSKQLFNAEYVALMEHLGMTPRTIKPGENPAPRSFDPAPRSFDPAPRSFDPAPRSFDPAPRSFDPAPRSFDLAPRSFDLAPRSFDPAPRSFDPAPRSFDPAPRSFDPAPRSFDPAPRSEPPHGTTGARFVNHHSYL